MAKRFIVLATAVMLVAGFGTGFAKGIDPNPKLRLLANAATTWRLRKDRLYVPERYTGTGFDPLTGDERAHYDVAYQWAIGDEVPDNILDVKARDWCEGVRVRFDGQWHLPASLPDWKSEQRK